MTIFKLSTGVFGTAIKILGTVALLTSEVVVPYINRRITKNITEPDKHVTYDSVIGTVMNSSMLSDYKLKVIAIIPKDGDSETFKAIIQIVDSDMNSAKILEAVKYVCTK